MIDTARLDFPRGLRLKSHPASWTSLLHGGTMVYRDSRNDRIWYCRFQLRGKRIHRSLPECRTKWQAQQAEQAIRAELFDQRFGKRESNTTLAQFIDREFLPWSKSEKKSWASDVSRC